MKRLILTMMMGLLVLGLSACDDIDTNTDDDNNTDSQVTSVVQALEDAGYELTEHDADSRAYFSDNTIADLGLDLNVTGLYIGYLDGGAWAQVIEFETTSAAQLVAAAFTAADEDQLVYRDGNTILLTYTQSTYDLFGE